jgi:2-desacetyl-2-hydroxyethyl bacteriochlorophyllide A dehydrogenase
VTSEAAVRVVPRPMRAAVLWGPGEIVLRTKPVPEVGPEDVLVRVEKASLCGTDLKILSRKFFADGGPPPGEFTSGHEYAGTVAAVGRSVVELRVGQRVVSEAHRGCMRCDNCLSGAYTACLNYGRSDLGHRAQGMTVDGGFAEYVVNHVSTLHVIPENVTFEEAVVLTTAGTVMHAFDTLRGLVVGSRVAVIGLGPIGLLAVQVARQLGAGSVVALGTRDSRLRLARQYGADLLVNVRDDGSRAVLDSLREEARVDVVLECSGATSALGQALRIVRRGGKLVLVGFYEGPATLDVNDAVFNAITIHTVRGEGYGAVPKAIALAARGRLEMGSVITHRFKFEDIASAFETYQDRSNDALKVLIDIGAGTSDLRGTA